MECYLINIRVYDNEIAFRLRGPDGSGNGAYVTIINSIAYNNEKVFRIEDDLELLHIYNGTFNKRPGDVYFQNVSGGYNPAGFDLRNCLFKESKPPDAADPSNLISQDWFFIDPQNHDYHLASASPAIDSGVNITEVTEDFDGHPRLPGFYDVGAYEFQIATGMMIPQEKDIIPQNHFFSNYPNPFNSQTRIRFSLKRSARVKLSIFNLHNHVKFHF